MKTCSKADPPSHDIVLARYGTGQLRSTETMVRRYVEQKMRDNIFNTRNEDGFLQGVAARKGNPRGNPKGNGKDTRKDQQHGD